jgi:hypothetical protein
MLGISDGIAFLVGVGVGAAGQYFADKYTDKRRAQEGHSAARGRFQELVGKIPGLLREMAKDFAGADGDHVRDIAILPNRQVIFNASHPFFVYYEDEHTNLLGQFAIIENYGYVTRTGYNSTPKFRATEEFAGLLRGYTP